MSTAHPARLTVTVIGMSLIAAVGALELVIAPLTVLVFDACPTAPTPLGCSPTAQHITAAVPALAAITGTAAGLALPWRRHPHRPRPLLLLPGATVLATGLIATHILTGYRLI